MCEGQVPDGMQGPPYRSVQANTCTLDNKLNTPPMLAKKQHHPAEHRKIY